MTSFSLETNRAEDKLIHQDVGQRQMYVNYYDRYEKLENENTTIGILWNRNSSQNK